MPEAPFAIHRRAFLGHGTAGLLSVASLRLPAAVRPRLDVLDVGVVGLGRVGMRRLAEFLDIPGCRVLAVCDVFEERQEQGRRLVDKQYGNKDCNAYTDYRDLLRSEDLDAVVIATPDHWHALMTIAAFRRGVDVFCEGPLTLTIDEGREIAAAERLTGRILQTGMAWRADPNVRRLCEVVRNGRLGALRSIRGELERGPVHAAPLGKRHRIPAGFNYDVWLGPAPAEPFHPKRVSGFQWIRNYSGGRMTEQGLQLVDIAQWATGRDAIGPTSFRGKADFPKKGLFDTATRFHVDAEYADGLTLSLATTGRQRLTIGGKNGTLRYWPATGKVECDPVELFTRPFQSGDVRLPGPFDVVNDFIDAVLTRRSPLCPLAVGRRSADICHLANIALTLGREFEWDPARGQIEDKGVRRFLRRVRRPHWTMKM